MDKFDHRVEIRGEDGSIIREQYYKKLICSHGEFNERPLSSGKIYNAGGQKLKNDELPDEVRKHFNLSAYDFTTQETEEDLGLTDKLTDEESPKKKPKKLI